MSRFFLSRRALGRAAAPAAPSQDIEFSGDYGSWEAAARDSTGYDAAIIVERTRDALLRVKRGEAAYERDSVTFAAPDYPFPLLTGLLRAVLVESGRLSVMDFGGSLGTSYYQCRRLLAARQPLEWCVIEQAAHASCGREFFENAELRFFTTIEDCLAAHRPNVLLLSSVLQYLPGPYETLAKLLQVGVPHLILDRIGFVAGERDRLTVQTVPERIYPASYPAWFFTEANLGTPISDAGYRLVAEFRRTDHDHVLPPDDRAYYKGFIYERTGRSSNDAAKR